MTLRYDISTSCVPALCVFALGGDLTVTSAPQVVWLVGDFTYR